MSYPVSSFPLRSQLNTIVNTLDNHHLNYSRNLNVGLIEYKGFGADGNTDQPYAFTVDYSNSLIDIGDWNIDEFPKDVRNILKSKSSIFKIISHAPKHSKEKSKMTKDKDTSNSFINDMPERSKLDLKISAEVDQLAKNVSREATLDKAHNRSVRIAKQINKALGRH